MAYILTLFVNVKTPPIFSQEPGPSRAWVNYLAGEGYLVFTSSDESESAAIRPTQLEVLQSANSSVDRDYRLLSTT
jgi:hypothetical protein